MMMQKDLTSPECTTLSMKTNDETWKPTSILKHLKISAVILFYIATSISVVLTNKIWLSQFPLPLTLLLGQLLCAVLILNIISLTQHPTVYLYSASSRLTLPTLKTTMPMFVINAVGLAFNTICLQHVDAVMYQVARSLIIPFTIAIGWISLNQKSSINTILSCCVISLGFLYGAVSDRSVTPNLKGFIYGSISALTTAIHSHVIKQTAQQSKQSTISLVYYNNLFSAILLIPVVLVFEHNGLLITDWTRQTTIQTFAIGIAVTGALGLLINFAGFLQIKLTSAVTHTVSSTARSVLQCYCASILLNEKITIHRFIGIVVTLAGSTWYALAKLIVK